MLHFVYVSRTKRKILRLLSSEKVHSYGIKRNIDKGENREKYRKIPMFRLVTENVHSKRRSHSAEQNCKRKQRGFFYTLLSFLCLCFVYAHNDEAQHGHNRKYARNNDLISVHKFLISNIINIINANISARLFFRFMQNLLQRVQIEVGHVLFRCAVKFLRKTVLQSCVEKCLRCLVVFVLCYAS